MNNAAAMSFFFLLSLAPLLIFLVSLTTFLRINNLASHILEEVSRVVPADSMTEVRHLLMSVSESNYLLLSVEIVGVIWAGSAGFASMSDALSSAYRAKEARPLWKRELVAIGLTIEVGAMLITALSLWLLGARIGSWVAALLGINSAWSAAWPYIRWLAIAGLTFCAIEMLYFTAPNVKQRFTSQLPGVGVAIVLWLASSLGLGLYLRRFGLAPIYGTLEALIVIMLWFYFSSLAILIGAEVNAQIQLTSFPD